MYQMHVSNLHEPEAVTYPLLAKKVTKYSSDILPLRLEALVVLLG